MNEEKRLTYTRKVNLATIIVCWVVIILYVLGNLIGGMTLSRLIEVIILAILMIVIPTILHLKKGPTYSIKKMIIFNFSLYMYYNLFRAQDLGNFRALFIFFLGLIIVSLYLDKKLLLLYTSFISLANTLIFFFFPWIMLPVDLMSYLQFLVGLIGSTLLLYFMTKWGHEMLENSEECWKYALKGSGDGVWDWNLEAGIIFYSHTLLSMLGKTKDPVNDCVRDDLGRYQKNMKDPKGLIDEELEKWKEELHPQDRDRAYGSFISHLEGETPFYEEEYRRVNEKGNYPWILDRGRVILRKRDGTPLRIVGTSTDITTRKENEEKLNLYAQEIKKANQKIKNDIFKASQLHQKFLPTQLPEIEGYSFATYYKPTADLGGDFYNILYKVYYLNEKVLFYLADVSGHGLDGALLNIFLRETINSYLLTHKDTSLHPSNILKYVASKYSREPFPDDYFICLLVGILDLKKKELTYSGTGFQIPPLVITGEGEFMDLLHGGLPISKAIDTNLLQYEEDRFSLEPGTCCLFTTDGIIEEENKKEIYGLERIKRIIKENQTSKALDILNVINHDFYQFTGNQQGHDDITYFLIKVLEEVR